MKYTLDLKDRKDLKRIQEFIELYHKKMQLLNEDSENSLDGGAMCHYIVDIKFKEEWI